MAKNFVDYEGLKHYSEKLKTYIDLRTAGIATDTAVQQALADATAALEAIGDENSGLVKDLATTTATANTAAADASAAKSAIENETTGLAATKAIADQAATDAADALSQLSELNVGVTSVTGDNTLISATGTDAVTVSATDKLTNAVASAEAAATALAGLSGTVAEAIAAAKKEILTGDDTEELNSAYNTLKAVAEWIDNNDEASDAAGLTKGVADNAAAITALQQTVNGTGEGDAHVDGLADKVAALEGVLGTDSIEDQATAAAEEVVKAVAGTATATDAKSLVSVTIAQAEGALTDTGSSVTVNTASLKDKVGLVQDADGTWKSTDGTVSPDALATAADIATELIKDEKVIAEALNDHEDRLGTVEGLVTGDNAVSAQIASALASKFTGDKANSAAVADSATSADKVANKLSIANQTASGSETEDYDGSAAVTISFVTNDLIDAIFGADGVLYVETSEEGE